MSSEADILELDILGLDIRCLVFRHLLQGLQKVLDHLLSSCKRGAGPHHGWDWHVSHHGRHRHGEHDGPDGRERDEGRGWRGWLELHDGVVHAWVHGERQERLERWREWQGWLGWQGWRWWRPVLRRPAAVWRGSGRRG